MFHNKLVILAFLLMGCSLSFAASQMSISLAGAKLPEHAGYPNVPIDKEAETTTNAVTEGKITHSTSSTSTSTSTTTTPATISSTTSSTSTSTSTSSTTTTAKPTTAKTTMPTTTVPPKTTTTAAPNTTTPAPAPGPFPAPVIGHWNSSCIAIKMAAQLNFTYETKDNKYANALYNLPADAKVEDSNCDNANYQSIQLNWGPVEAQHSFTMQFDKKNESTILSMIKINLPLTSDSFPNAKENETIQLIHRGADFGTPVKMSYHCTRAQKFNLTETIQDKDIIGFIVVHDVQVEAFRSANATGFSNVHDCDSSETSDVVPIAVGIALVGLILIVLISYLCARRRSTSRGYMSF